MGGIGAGPPRLRAPTRLTSAHDLSGFDCGRGQLNDWLRRHALGARSATTFVVAEGSAVVGYYCLAAGSVARGAAPGQLRRNAPDPLPVVIIGRLACDLGHQGRGLGADLLRDALIRILSVTETVGARAVLVHALDDKAGAFWRRFGFLEFPAGAGAYFLPVERIAAAV